MNIITNEKLIKRNTRIAQIAGLTGLAVLAGSMILVFTRPEQFGLTWGLLLAGFLLSQVGIYFTNRWGRRPRPDEHLTNALKGLGRDYSIFHFTTPTPHLLVGPAGVWVLLPHYQRGTITYERGRWRQRGGGFLLNYMKIFGQEGLGRPDLEIDAEKESILRFLRKLMPDSEISAVQAALVFTNEDAQLIDLDEAPAPTLPAKKLKEFIRKTAKTKPLSTLKAKEIQDAILGAVTGVEVREEAEEESDKPAAKGKGKAKK
jgi:hypothetical protein